MSSTNTPLETTTERETSKPSLKGLTNLYNNLSYFDQYGSSVILLIFVTMVLFILCSYCFVFINAQPIKDDWINQRCKPSVIPFAGIINKPHDMSATDFTKQNFDYCTQNIVKGVTGNAVQPLTFVTDSLTAVYESVQTSLNSAREMFNKVRKSLSSVAEEIMGRMLNIMAPLITILISMKDVLAKTQGVMTSALMTSLGSYYTLKSLMGAILQLIITILIGYAAIIASLWAVPFTWGLASVNTGIYVALSIPAALIIAFMVEILHVKTNLKIPKLKCFDKNTLLALKKGGFKRIEEVEVGEVLSDDQIITAKMKVCTEGSTMYNLNNVIVSNSHSVQYREKWIAVEKHPNAIKLKQEDYKEPYLYCLNTSSKYIVLNNTYFSDWDTLFENEIDLFKNLLERNHFVSRFSTYDIHKYFDGGFTRNTEIRLLNGKVKPINEIQVGDILEDGEKVYGVVEVKNDITNNKRYFDLGEANNFHVKQYVEDGKVDCSSIKSLPLIHLLTDKGRFKVGDCTLLDYNSLIDSFFQME